MSSSVAYPSSSSSSSSRPYGVERLLGPFLGGDRASSATALCAVFFCLVVHRQLRRQQAALAEVSAQVSREVEANSREVAALKVSVSQGVTVCFLFRVVA